MKKLVSIILLLSLMPFSLLSQEEEHLKFKGVPIDGTLKEFTSKLVKTGLKEIGQENGQVMLFGDFAGFRDCMIYATTTPGKDLVYMVAAMLNPTDHWSALQRDYEALNSMLKIKYGEPSEVIEEFQSFSKPKSDSEKILYLKTDRCNYQTIFDTKKGRIAVKLAHGDKDLCFVIIAYEDGINALRHSNAAIDDL